MFGFDVDLLAHAPEKDEDHMHDDDCDEDERNVWYHCTEHPDYVDFCYEYITYEGNCLIAAAYDGQTVIDSCDSFEEYRFDNMDFEWYGSDDACHENSDSGDCLADIIDYVDAQGCYYQSRYNVSEDMDECIAVVEIDGQYYPGKCEELAEMFGVPYGEDVDDEDGYDEDYVVEWLDC